jgi:type IV pilus assembly protein PilN
MIKINLIQEAKPAKKKSFRPQIQGVGDTFQNLLVIGVVLLGALIIGWRWVSLGRESSTLSRKIAEAEKEKKRLEVIIQKADRFKAQKELLNRKIALITELKKNQSGPVHLLDQVSVNLPDFLWLESMVETNGSVFVRGKATTYNAVSNFYNNLTDSPYFSNVVLGPTATIPTGVSFSLTCIFAEPSQEPATGA